MKTKDELLREISDCVLDMEDEQVVEITNEYIKCGYPAIEGILHGLVNGMQKAAKLFEEEEYFIPELLICSETMYNGLDVLKPHVEKKFFQNKKRIVIGVIEGDTHDIGKNLVKIMMESAGYEVFDLGRDVSPSKFVEKVKETKASALAISTLMSTTMLGMQNVIQLLIQEGIRDNVKVIVGGAPVSLAFSKKIGADGYSSNAVEAVRLIDELLID